MADSTVHVKVVPEIDEEALLNAVLKVIAGHAVVRPRETLVIRSAEWYPDQAEQYQEYLDHRDLPFGVLVVIGDELAVAKPEPEPEPEATVSIHVSGDASGLAEEIKRLVRQAAAKGAGLLPA